MEIGRKKKLSQKILIVMLTTLVLFNFIMPTVVRADDDEEEIGGGLFTPIQSLLVGLGDSIMRLMQIAFTGSNSVTTTIKYSDDDIEIKEKAWWLSENFDWKEKVNWDIINSKKKKAKIKVPTIEISPESIFSGKIPAFDINFFTPQDSEKYENYHYEQGDKKIIRISELITGPVSNMMDIQTYFKEGEYTETVHGGATIGTGVYYENTNYEELLKEYGWTIDENVADGQKDRYSYNQEKGASSIKGTSIYVDSGLTFEWEGETEGKVSERRYTLTVTHRYATNANRSSAVITKLYEETVNKVIESDGEKHSTAAQLRDIVSYWYNLLRNIAIIGLLSVLVYIGIRIVLSSAASDKSKYKEMLKDWAVAICLLFFMHYFMNFTVTIINTVSEALVPSDNLVVTEQGITIEQYQEETTRIPYTGDKLIGDVRIKLQTGDALQRMAYTIIYIVLIIYTFVFAIMYLKRVLYMAFFTMMAPLVALMYPLDKVRDGKAQAFDMWIKEYTFNALIQPFHLIIYYVLVSSAIDLAQETPLYALVAIGFMMPAEKLLRKFFGFNKSETSGVLGGAVGGAMLMQGINALTKSAGRSGGKKQGGGNSKEKADKQNVRTADSGKNMNELLDGMSQEGESNSTSNPSNAIPIGDSNYSAQQERLDELKAEGFGEGDEEYDKAKAELDKYKLDAQLEEDMGQSDDSINMEDEPFENDESKPFDNSSTNNTDINDSNANQSDNDDEKPHKLRAFAKMGGRFVLKGGIGAAKLAARGAAVATLGTIGVAAGLASDDYSNVFKFGAAGLAAGNAVAGAGINRVSKLPSDAYRVKKSYENVRDKFEQDAYSAKERKRRANERADDAFMKDKEAIRLYKDKFGEQYRQAMEDAKEYRSYGITDNDTIIKAMKLDTKGLPTDRRDKRRILIAGTAPQLNRKDINQYGERLKKRGFNDKQAEIMQNAIRQFNDFE